MLLLSVRGHVHRRPLPSFWAGRCWVRAFVWLLMAWAVVYQMEMARALAMWWPAPCCRRGFLPVVILADNPQVLQERFDLVSEQFQSLGLEMDPQVMEAMIHLVLRVQPSVEFISLLLSFLLAFRLAFLLAPRFGIPFPEAPPMMLWRPWEELIWVTIGALALSLLGVSWLADLALNAVVVMSVIYAAQGLAVLRFFSRRHGVPSIGAPFYIALYCCRVWLLLGWPLPDY